MKRVKYSKVNRKWPKAETDLWGLVDHDTGASVDLHAGVRKYALHWKYLSKDIRVVVEGVLFGHGFSRTEDVSRTRRLYDPTGHFDW